MKLLIGLMLGCASLITAQQEETVLNLPPDSPFVLKDPGIKMVAPNGSPALLVSRQTPANFVDIVENSSDVTIFRIPNPKITAIQYALTGEVAYKNVPTNSQLELVTDYLKFGTFYSRTESDGGLQQRLAGTGEFRPFALPLHGFDPVMQAELHVIFQGRSVIATPTGTNHEESVSLRNLKLVQYKDNPTSAPATGAAPSAPAADPAMQVITSIQGDACVAPELKSEPDTSVAFPVEEDGTKGLALTWTGHDTQTQLHLLELPPDLLRQVTSNRFGLVGEVRSSRPAGLDLELEFVPRAELPPPLKPPHTDLPATTEWRPFQLQFDRANSGLVLQGLSLWSTLFGSGQVRALPLGSNLPPTLPPDATKLELRHIQLVQFKDPISSAPSTSQSPATSAAAFSPSSFALGIAATLVFMLAAAALTATVRSSRKKHHERELRRIASLDT
jgi:hypothetical protein